MHNAIYVAILTLLFAVNTGVNAGDCIKDSNGNPVCGNGQCALDQYGKVLCARAGGGALRDRFGDVRCGLGRCATDDQGQVMCSREPGGDAMRDTYGKVKCLGECAPAKAELCDAAR